MEEVYIYFGHIVLKDVIIDTVIHDIDTFVGFCTATQERATLWFASSESESDGNERFSSDGNDGGNFQEFFESQTEGSIYSQLQSSMYIV